MSCTRLPNLWPVPVASFSIQFKNGFEKTFGFSEQFQILFINVVDTTVKQFILKCTILQRHFLLPICGRIRNVSSVIRKE